MKKLISLTLAFVLLISAMPMALAAQSLSNFYPQREYADGTFTDVPRGAWYAEYVTDAYEYGFIDGRSARLFVPQGSLTIAEAIKLACTLHMGYFENDGVPAAAQGEKWYTPYVGYALESGIISSEYKNYDAPATRSDFAVILAAALPEEALAVRNRIDDGAVPDVAMTYSYAAAVYGLYRAGVLTGSDAAGTFRPNSTITRAEVAAIIMRMADEGSRLDLALRTSLTAEEIARKCEASVFYVEVFDKDGQLAKTGSGFFISDSGLAVTNRHVMVGGSSAKVTTLDGEVHDVTGIYDMERSIDLALIQVRGTGFPCLETADSSALSAGSRIYALGSPLGLQNTLSEGIISAPSRMVDGTEYIQIDAPISSGSSGGALLDTFGRVIGVTTAGFNDGQNMNLCIPINAAAQLSTDKLRTVQSFIQRAEFYPEGHPYVDFGVYMGVSPVITGEAGSAVTYYYALDEVGGYERAITKYEEILEYYLFQHIQTYLSANGESGRVYAAPSGEVISVMIEDYDGTECLAVALS